MSLGDRVAIMRRGVPQQVCEPRQAYHLPENVFVAAFIGAARINLLQATVGAPLGGGMWNDPGRQRLGTPEPLDAWWCAPARTCGRGTATASPCWWTWRTLYVFYVFYVFYNVFDNEGRRICPAPKDAPMF